MRIFFNDRTIEFASRQPEEFPSSDRIIRYSSPGDLKNGWTDFLRDERFQRLVIVENPGEVDDAATGTTVKISDFPGLPHAFREFAQFFRYIPAAGGIVKNEKGDWLFIHRYGKWDLPKGKIDRQDIREPGATLDDRSTARMAAIREVREETGLVSVSVVGDLPPTWHIYSIKDKLVLKKTSWFEMKADSRQPLRPGTEEGISRVTWIPSDAIPPILPGTYASLRELILEVGF
jgi:8-oxo-dGTP pyrophosphatase MutT (NUDIX family)